MASRKKSKLKVKLTRQQRKQLKAIGTPLAIGAVCLLVGFLLSQLITAWRQPTNIVWAADSTVRIPRDLKAFLHDQNDCHEYRGTGSPKGVGLWGVYQVSKGKFAKVAYGCSWSLSNYIMAVKEKSGWRLLPPTEYFAPFANTTSTGALPLCKYIDLYQIDASIEPFCIAGDGSAKTNDIK